MKPLLKKIHMLILTLKELNYKIISTIDYGKDIMLIKIKIEVMKISI